MSPFEVMLWVLVVMVVAIGVMVLVLVGVIAKIAVDAGRGRRTRLTEQLFNGTNEEDK